MEINMTQWKFEMLEEVLNANWALYDKASTPEEKEHYKNEAMAVLQQINPNENLVKLQTQESYVCH